MSSRHTTRAYPISHIHIPRLDEDVPPPLDDLPVAGPGRERTPADELAAAQHGLTYYPSSLCCSSAMMVHVLHRIGRTRTLSHREQQ